jgi:arabinosaccharide transport system substrate-binding protein
MIRIIRQTAQRLNDWFPFGPAPLLILLLMLISGVWLLFNPVERSDADLEMWTFAKNHVEAYENAIPEFEKAHQRNGRPVEVDLQLVHNQAVGVRLRSAFWADSNVPDMVEVMTGWAGSFFIGPVENVGFVDLRPYLERSGLMDRLVRSRLAPYTNRGRIFGLPHDVHPVMIAYRADLFQKHGIDPQALDTWDKFIEAGRRITIAEGGQNDRYMLNLSRKHSGHLSLLLRQRGGNFFDADGRVTLDSEKAVQTMLFYVPLLEGAGRIADDPGSFGAGWVRSVENGYCLAFLCPDWNSKNTEQQIPQMAGKMALMPLPAVEPGGRRTSTWGGTMLGITKQCRDKELAWQLARHLYTDEEDLESRFRDTNILPPITTAWTRPAFSEPRPYWSGGRREVKWTRTTGRGPAGTWQTHDGATVRIEPAATAGRYSILCADEDGPLWEGRVHEAQGRLQGRVANLDPDGRWDRVLAVSVRPPDASAGILSGEVTWGQPLGTLYAHLAEEVPAVHPSPYTELANAEMSTALADCLAYYKDHGEDGLEAFVRRNLKAAADRIRLQMTRNPFGPTEPAGPRP